MKYRVYSKRLSFTFNVTANEWQCTWSQLHGKGLVHS